MALRHGAHHGVSYVLGILASVLLAELFKVIFPDILRLLDAQSLKLIHFFRINAGVRVVSTLIVAFFLIVLFGMLWGDKTMRK